MLSSLAQSLIFPARRRLRWLDQTQLTPRLPVSSRPDRLQQQDRLQLSAADQAALAMSGHAVPQPKLVGLIIILSLILLWTAPVAGMPLTAVAIWVFTRARRNQRKITNEFAADFPAILYAMASSIKAGMAPLGALERSVDLLPKRNLVRAHVDSLLRDLRRGVSREQAIARFGSSIPIGELELFRGGLLLAIENGGRFVPTLERIAQVSRDRSALIQSARVSTESMRMTSTVLLAITPLVLVMESLNTDEFWSTLLSHPVASPLALIGATIIGCGYFILRRMSAFEP
jgi:Flp pilus assembly protein TadB